MNHDDLKRVDHVLRFGTCMECLHYWAVTGKLPCIEQHPDCIERRTCKLDRCRLRALIEEAGK